MWDTTDVTPTCGYEAEMAKNDFKAKKGKQPQNSKQQGKDAQATLVTRAHDFIQPSIC